MINNNDMADKKLPNKELIQFWSRCSSRSASHRFIATSVLQSEFLF